MQRKISESKQFVCANCNKKVEKLFQNNYCKSCLAIMFKKYKKIIDKVRKDPLKNPTSTSAATS
jgi:hypothetical protein